MSYKRKSPMPVAEGGTALTTITAHDIIVGNGTGTPALVAPSATSGVPIISQGAAADPVYGTAVVAGGGTGRTTLTIHDVLIGNTTSAVTMLAPNATAGIPLVSQGASSDPAYTTAVVSGGGTGRTTITAHDLMIGNGTSAVTLLAPGATSGVPLIAKGAALDPAYGTAVVAGGGTGLTTITAHDILIGNGTSNVTLLAPSATSGAALISQGAASNPAYGSITVPSGGTGLASATAYAPICGGTTTTGAFQSASTGQGTSGYIFTSTGASSLPSFQGIVNLPATTSSLGQVQINSLPFLHGFGTNNTFIGTSSGNFTLSNTDNTGVGYNTFHALTSANTSTAVGSGALAAATSGGANTAVGKGALASVTTTGSNSALGYNSLNLCTGGNNSAMGNLSLSALVGGSYNSCMGDSAGINYTGSESSNICINSPGTLGESNVMRIGSGTGTGTQQLNAAFISGITGITVTGAAVLVSTSDQLGVAVSSSRYKENIADMGDYSSPILKLRPVSFTYIDHKDTSIQTGLIAEEVEKIMPSLVLHNKEGLVQTVKYHDLPALILNELQKAVKRIDALEVKLGGM
jgi:hypothetical protein